MAIKGLTPKQEKFAQGVASGLSLSDSYRNAYNTKNTSDVVINKEASILMADRKIAVRVHTIHEDRTRAVTALAVSDEDLVLTGLREHAKPGYSDSHSNQLRALEVLGRTIPGLFKGEKPAAPQPDMGEVELEILSRLGALQATQDKDKDQPDSAVH